MKKLFNIENLTSLFFYFSILIFIIGFNFTDSPPPFGWYQQFMPNLGGKPISDLFFIDSLTGWSVTYTGVAFDSAYILKTINGGDNWNIIYFDKNNFTKIKFINQNTGYTSGVTPYIGASCINKSTNGGLNWFAVPPPDPFFTVDDISILNEDTIWVAVCSSTSGGVFRTTNGGQNWTQKLYLVSNNPNKIYMFNSNIGFISTTGAQIYKTTNSGVNWTLMQSNEVFTDMFFADSLTGWKAGITMKKTIDGGNNWLNQPLPIVNWLNQMLKFSNVNRDTIWGVGGVVQWVPSSNNFRGIVYKTVNGGTNWYYQIPDTGANYYQLKQIKFINKQNGWAYLSSMNPYTGFNGFHTVTGGDTTTYSGIKEISSNEPLNFILYQNYPNPFNPVTNIKYQITKSSYVKLEVIDITGKEVKQLVNQKQTPGEYQVEFDCSGFSSGVYFYRLLITNEKGGIEYVETKKAILLK